MVIGGIILGLVSMAFLIVYSLCRTAARADCILAEIREREMNPNLTK